jgi:hypothetical protein
MTEIQGDGPLPKAGTLDEFRTYLMTLSSEADAATGHVRGEGDTASWINATLPQFIAGLASGIAAVDEATTGGETLTWQQLALFLFAARNQDPTVFDTAKESIATPEDVSSRDDLLAYLGWLHHDFILDQEETAERARQGLWSHEGRWAHAELASWFEAWAAWLDGRRARAMVEPVTWKSCAIQLAAARVYE